MHLGELTTDLAASCQVKLDVVFVHVRISRALLIACMKSGENQAIAPMVKQRHTLDA